MEKKMYGPNRPAAGRTELWRGLPGDFLPLGVYPAFDDDLPRDTAFENFSAPDLRDLRLYPWGLE